MVMMMMLTVVVVGVDVSGNPRFAFVKSQLNASSLRLGSTTQSDPPHYVQNSTENFRAQNVAASA